MKKHSVADGILQKYTPEYVNKIFKEIILDEEVRNDYQSFSDGVKVITELFFKIGYWKALEDVKKEIEDQWEMIIHSPWRN